MNTTDFIDNSLSGIATVRFGRAIIQKTLSSDILTERSETFYINIRTGSNEGTIVHTTDAVSVNDTSVQSERLYFFDSFTFNNASATGRYGPSLSSLLSSYNTSTYTWLSDTNYFNSTDGIQLWTVPKTGTYRITAVGAIGGRARYANDIGGKGAIMQGDFNLTLNQKIKILVGQRGNTDFSYFYGGSGGGGTFVVNNTVGIASTSDILVIAGGGGGHGENSGNTPGLANATISDPAVGGATGGNGNGGGGFLTDGGNSQIYGKSFLNGGTGGSGANNNGFDGSFGGGGASSSANGGGYSGGYGGSSINNGSNQSNSVGNTGHGYVVITAL
jgi:hypothetical protein